MAIVLSRELALRLEAAEVAASEAALAKLVEARPDLGASSIAAAGGRALFFGADSPLSQALSLGLSGPTSADEVDRLERFFSERSTATVISLCPYADPSLVDALAGRGYRITHFENTLVREIRAVERFGVPLDVRPATPLDRVHWTRLVTQGFSPDGQADESLVELMGCMFGANGVVAYYGYADGEPAAGGGMSIRGGLAMLHGDATLARFRGRGLQAALIRARLAKAAHDGCGMAFACTLAGSQSQRNYERAGFQVAYTKTMLVKDQPNANR